MDEPELVEEAEQAEDLRFLEFFLPPPRRKEDKCEVATRKEENWLVSCKYR